MKAPSPPDPRRDEPHDQAHDQALDEVRAVAERYARRTDRGLYDPGRPEVRQARQEHDRVLRELLSRHLHRPMADLDVLEIGCGHGDQLLALVALGFDPARLVANELLPDRVAVARGRLPPAIRLHAGDALQLLLPDGCFDLVVQSMVFSSLLDDAFQHRLAERMWRWLRPGGAVIWHDFTVDNPRNPDVRGVPLARVRALFPAATIDARRVTLAPPLGRAVVRLHPGLWRVFNALPLLRTHVLAWIEKPA